MRTSPILWFIPALIVFIGILLLSTVLSLPIQVQGISFSDKLSHVFAYLVLIVTLLLAFHKNELLRTTNWILLIIFCSLYGILLEYLQYSVFPNRYFEWLDAVANVSGALIGSLTFRLWRGVKKKKA